MNTQLTQFLHLGQQFLPNSPAEPKTAMNKRQLYKDLRTRLNRQDMTEQEIQGT